MNGIGLLVLIAAAGQITAAQTSGPNRDFGWELDTQNPDKALCYIIQLSPENVAEMQGKAIEKRSDMPPELVGRATRILVRIGTDVLPQTPTLEELRNMPRFNSPADVTAQLGGGRLSDVDPSELQNVQQRGSNPPLPSFPGQSSAAPQSSGSPQFSGNAAGTVPPASGPTMPRSNFSDSASTDSANPIDQAKQLDRGVPAFPTPRANTPVPNYADSGSSQTDRAGTTANSGTLPNNAGAWRTPTIDESQRSRDEVNRTADNRSQTQGGGNYPQSNYPQSTVPPNYDSRIPPSLDPSTMTSIPNRAAPNIGFGANSNGQNQGKFGLSTPGYDNFSGQGGQVGQGTQYGQNGSYNQGYGGGQYSGQYGNGQFVGGNGQRPNGQNGFDGRDLIASNTTLPPPNTNTSSPQQPPAKNSASEKSPGDTENNTLTSPSSSKTSENILSVFFLFSLVVNFYLGMLIRKLLTRYRALLANMRGQASPNAFSS